MKPSMVSPARKRRRFANAMITALRRSGVACPIRYDSHEDVLLIGGERDNPGKLFLGNAYRRYCAASPGRREAVLRDYTRLALMPRESKTPSRFDQARPHLMPYVQARIAYTPRGPTGESHRDEAGLWHRPLGDHLAVGLAYDEPHTIKHVTEGELAEWGVGGEEALAIACENLRRRSTQPFQSPAPGVFVSPWMDNYDASRLALTDLVRDLEVKGNYVALAPNRDTLIITGSEDPAGLRVMLGLAEDVFHGAYRVSGVAVRLRNGRWEPFEPDARYPGLEGFRALRLHSLGAANQQQRKALLASHEVKAAGVSVASYLMMSNRGQTHRTSFAIWPEGLTTLLPRTERVSFMPGDPARLGQIAAFADWERAREVVGHLMTPLDLYPPRFGVDRFPTDEELKALGFAPGFESLGTAHSRGRCA